MSSTAIKAIIIGAGVGGLATAIHLAKLGLDVTIFEKNKLGGQFNLAYLPPQKGNLKKIVDYFIAELFRLKIPVIYKEAKEEDIVDGNFDRAIIATGAIPVIPSIKGLQKYYWTEFLNDNQLPQNETVLIIGGGLIALEVASKLIEGKNQIIIIEMLDEVGRGMEMLEKAHTLKKMLQNGVQIYTKHTAVEINGDNVYIENEHNLKTKIEGVDKIIIAAGMKSYIPFNPESKMAAYYIGDARSVGKAENAIHDAYKLALTV